MYDKTWAAIDAGLTARQEGDQRTFPQLSQWIRAFLSTDRKRQVEEVGCTIESLPALDPPPFKRGMGPYVGVVKGCGQ